MKEIKKGKLIVIEGLDGCGKTTQSSMLTKRLTDCGIDNMYVTFPDYESESSAPLRMYLRGDFGKRPEDVNAYAASSLFAVDRFASFKTSWQQRYEAGAVIVANRYTTSNAPHQMCKLDRSEWDGFLDWLFDYEYDLLGLPEPDLVIQLCMGVDVSSRLLTARYDGDETRRDIHESSAEYQHSCAECAVYAARRCGWHIIDCAQDGEPLPREVIADKVWSTVQEAGLTGLQ